MATSMRSSRYLALAVIAFLLISSFDTSSAKMKKANDGKKDGTSSGTGKQKAKGDETSEVSALPGHNRLLLPFILHLCAYKAY